MSTEIISQWVNLSNMRVERVLTYDSHTDLILSGEIKSSVCSGCGRVVEGVGARSLWKLSLRRSVRKSFMASRPSLWT